MLRLQAELEALKHVLRLVLKRNLDIDSQRKTQLEWFLRDASSLILRDSLGGFPQGPVFDELASTAAVVPLEAKAELSGLLKTVGTTAQTQVTDLLNSARGSLIFQGQTFITGGLTVTHQSKTIEIGGGAKIVAPVVIAESIQGSFNTLAESKADDAVKTALRQLLEAVAELSKALPPATASQVAQDADTLTREVSSAAPRRKWYELSLSGLKEAAEAVGGIGTPVVAAVKQLAGLLLP